MATTEAETRFRSTSPYGEDYRSAVADSTSGRNSDPIPVSYRQISSTSGNTSVPSNSTTATMIPGYGGGNGMAGDPMDFRPRQPEPAGETQGVGMEVEFDSKFTDAYANLDEVRDHNYHLARSPHRLENSANPVYAGGLPNPAGQKQQQKKRKCCSFLCRSILIILLVAVVLVQLGLAGFNLANTWSMGAYTGSVPLAPGVGAPTSPSALTGQELSQAVDQLREELDEMRLSFMEYSGLHASNFSFFKTELLRLEGRINELTLTPPLTNSPTTPTPEEDSDTTASPLNMTTPTPSTTALPPAISMPVYENCTMTLKQTCTVDTSTTYGPTDGSSDGLRFAFCSTNKVALEEEDGYLVDIFCSVRMTQNMPVTSTLGYSSGMFQCICNVLNVPNVLQDTLRSFDCDMYQRRCPREIRVPRN